MSPESSSAFAVAPVAPGDCVGRYELLYPVAQGGMGSVWVARLRGMSGFERLFAIKMVLPQYAAEPSFREMLLDEARIASRIAHPNVAPVIDIGEHQGGLYLVMEWIDGDSIHLMMRVATKRRERLPLAVILRVLADACGGLHAAHELRDKDGMLLDVVHRDVSPQNILVSVDGSSKLIDFGVAKARGRLHGDTSVGFIKGKLKFMAPEQASGRHVDRRSDIFGMGAVLFFLLTGEFAYDGPNDVSTLHALLAGRPRRPLPDTVPPVVAAIVDRAMQMDPQSRFQTAADLQIAIEEAVETLRLRAGTATVQACYANLMRQRIVGRAQSLEAATRTVEERAGARALLDTGALPKITGAAASGVLARPSGEGLLPDPENVAEGSAGPTTDRPTNPEPFAVRAAGLESSYRRLVSGAVRRRHTILGLALAMLAGGVLATSIAVWRAEKLAVAVGTNLATTKAADVADPARVQPAVVASAAAAVRRAGRGDRARPRRSDRPAVRARSDRDRTDFRRSRFGRGARAAEGAPSRPVVSDPGSRDTGEAPG